jgi:hypothetical protein
MDSVFPLSDVVVIALGCLPFSIPLFETNTGQEPNVLRFNTEFMVFCELITGVRLLICAFLGGSIATLLQRLPSSSLTDNTK